MVDNFPPLTPASIIPPDMDPLKASQEADQVEADLKSIFIAVFRTLLRQKFFQINLYGMPHLGNFTTVERHVKQEGLAMPRNINTEAYMRELFRAWRARNPRRGLAFLRYYLQLLWPDGSQVQQMWQDKAEPYPTALSPTDGGNHYLTSRLHVGIETTDADGTQIAVASAAMHTIIAARLVLYVYMLRRFESLGEHGIVMGNAFVGMEVGTFACDCILAPGSDYSGVPVPI
jgi:hypothetical protein